MNATHPAGRPRPAAPDLSPALAGELASFAVEQLRDRRNLSLGWTLAVLCHLVLLATQLPAGSFEPPPPPERVPIYVVEPIRFKQPEIELTAPPPDRPIRRMPIPDPTPDDPEPILPESTLAPAFVLPDSDVIFGDLPAPPPVVETSSAPVEVGNGVLPPVKVHFPQPQYTEAARRARIQGTVVVRTTIDVEGNVIDAEVVKSLPMGLDQAALDAVRQWQFQPATRGGRPVAVYFNLTVHFQLQ